MKCPSADATNCANCAQWVGCSALSIDHWFEMTGDGVRQPIYACTLLKSQPPSYQYQGGSASDSIYVVGTKHLLNRERLQRIAVYEPD